MAVSLFCTTNILLSSGHKRHILTDTTTYTQSHTEIIEIIRLRFISHMYIYINPAPGLYCVYCCRAAVKHRKVRATTGKKQRSTCDQRTRPVYMNVQIYCLQLEVDGPRMWQMPHQNECSGCKPLEEDDGGA